MTTLMSYDEVVQCIQHELELTGIADKKNAKSFLLGTMLRFML